MKQSINLLLKVYIDLWKRPNMFAELHPEIEIYRLLSPKLVLHGY
jgi:hypothetical protein